MGAPTAASLLKQIVANERQADAARLADLDEDERAAVVTALRRVSSKSRVDVGLLISESRRTAAAHREAAKAASDADAPRQCAMLSHPR
jgi:hypothetical protein